MAEGKFLEQLEGKAKAALLFNRKKARKRGVEYNFTCPSPYLYPWQWLWDSSFHILALRWFDPEFAKGEALSLLSQQWEDGRIPNMVHVRHSWRMDRFVHGTGRDSSGITQPPIIADAVRRIHEVSPDKAFLKAAYGPLKKYYGWLRDSRETDGDGLIAIYHPWESGIDNSPRWDDIFQVKHFRRRMFDLVKAAAMFRFTLVRFDDSRMREITPFFVKGSDMNSYYYFNLRAMAKIAGELGRKDDADEFEARAEKTRNAMLSRMWDEESQAFGDLVGKDEELVFTPTPFALLPMWAGVATADQSDKLCAQLTDPKKYWGEYPVATTAMDHPAFDPNEYWRGTVWININWFMTEGLARAGRADKANELKEKTLKLVDGGGVREYYNPLTGEGLGAKSFAWSTLVIDLINRDLKKEFGG